MKSGKGSHEAYDKVLSLARRTIQEMTIVDSGIVICCAMGSVHVLLKPVLSNIWNEAAADVGIAAAILAIRPWFAKRVFEKIYGDLEDRVGL